jgi:hypothetical protein
MLRLPIIVLLILPFSLHAQTANHASFSFGPSIGLPLNFNAGYKTGLGAGFRLYRPTTKLGSVYGNINFISYPGEFSNIPTATLTSVKVGYKSLFNSSSLFITGDAGAVFKSRSAGGGSVVSPGIGLGLGYSLPVGKSFIDFIPSFNAVFQTSSNRTWLDLHFAYRFNAK